MEKRGYQRSGKKQNGVAHKSHHHIKPKNGIIVPIRDFALVDNGQSETTLTQKPCDSRKNSQRTHRSIVRRREKPCQKDAEHKIEQLQRAIAYSAPEQPLGGAVFKSAVCHIAAKIAKIRLIFLIFACNILIELWLWTITRHNAWTGTV